jgi:ribosomal-protein-alanine N-acetyltransferase
MSHPWSTPRLLIRRFVAEDWQDFHELQGDPEATRFIGGAWPAEKTREVVKEIAENSPSKELEWLAVTDRNTGKVLGTCWLGNLNIKWCQALGIGPSIELGYRYAKQHWGKGYATEAARAMLQRGFDELNLPEIAAIVDIHNGASERVMQKSGMNHLGGAVRDGVTIRYYSVTKAEYLAWTPNRISP